ncbi:Transcription factor [Pleurostoma richardsiae]|uniref:Transcription factor n=1 Tax=Pleurostoma richardsiae TaxID=41990 RepID=A0AA38S4V4_9PEZI|nr:Transcription factor [Pleurostoma richardsiae]
MSSSSKQRQPRLRASCDGCFIAKVKCSKARPICSRCLACGIECRYSPSSRIGKPKSTDSSSHHSSTTSDVTSLSPVPDEKHMVYSAHHPSMTGLYKIETGWHTPPTSVDGSMSRNHSISSELALLGMEERGPVDTDPAVTNGDMYGTSMPWTPPTDLGPAQFSDSPMATALPHEHARSQSYDMSMSMPGWADPTQDMFSYSQVPTPTSMGSNYFPSPTATPNLRPVPPRHKSSPSSVANGGSCTCFTVCLQSLQALHNASSPASPPFDLVLSLNRKAVEGCAAMLACARCMNRSGSHTATMLLATVIGKITSFYKNASQSYFENGGPHAAPSATGLGVSLGAYQVNGEDGRWLELEILARELRKLQEVYARFREVCADLSDDPEVSKAMIGYLNHNLGSTLEVVSHRKGDMRLV